MTRDNIVGTLQGDSRLSGGLSDGGGTTDYEELENKPSINGVELVGNMTSANLGIWQPKNFSTDEQNTGLKWIDGKPLYQKVMYSVTQVQLVNTEWRNIPWIEEPTNIDLLIDAKLTNIVPNNNNSVRFSVVNGRICGASTNTGDFPPTSTPVYVIFYYTKTN